MAICAPSGGLAAGSLQPAPPGRTRTHPAVTGHSGSDQTHRRRRAARAGLQEPGRTARASALQVSGTSSRCPRMAPPVRWTDDLCTPPAESEEHQDDQQWVQHPHLAGLCIAWRGSTRTTRTSRAGGQTFQRVHHGVGGRHHHPSHRHEDRGALRPALGLLGEPGDSTANSAHPNAKPNSTIAVMKFTSTVPTGRNGRATAAEPCSQADHAHRDAPRIPWAQRQQPGRRSRSQPHFAGS